MTTEPDPDDSRDLIGKLFYLITATCEDAAEDAIKGQARELTDEAFIHLANRLHSAGEVISFLADAICAIITQRGGASKKRRLC